MKALVEPTKYLISYLPPNPQQLLSLNTIVSHKSDPALWACVQYRALVSKGALNSQEPAWKQPRYAWFLLSIAINQYVKAKWLSGYQLYIFFTSTSINFPEQTVAGRNVEGLCNPTRGGRASLLRNVAALLWKCLSFYFNWESGNALELKLKKNATWPLLSKRFGENIC